MVAATAIPTFQPGIGAKLYHSMWHYGARVCMAMAACTNKGIYIFYIVLLGICKTKCGDRKCGKYNFFHFLYCIAKLTFIDPG